MDKPHPIAIGRTIIAFGILTMAVYTAWNAWHKRQTADLGQAAGPSSDLPTVRVLQLGDEDTRSGQELFSGVVRATRSSALACKSLGRVDQVLVRIGDRVSEGQPLLILDSGEIAARVEQAEAELGVAQTVLNQMRRGPRRQELARAEAQVEELQALVAMRRAESNRLGAVDKPGVITPKAIDDARFSLSAAEAQLETASLLLDELREGTRVEEIDAQRAQVDASAARLSLLRLQLADATLKAPFAGTVQFKRIEEGEVVSPGQVVFELVTDELEVRVGLPPRVARQVTPDSTPVRVFVGNREFAGHIASVAPALDSVAGTRSAIIRLDETCNGVAAGESAQVAIRTDLDDQGWWIPTPALTATHGVWSVLVATPSDDKRSFQVEARAVEVLRTVGEATQVQGDIHAGMLLIREGIHRVTAGQHVAISRGQVDRHEVSRSRS